MTGGHPLERAATARRARLPLKTQLLTLVVILANVFGNFALSFGLKAQSAKLSSSPLDYIRSMLNVWVALGVSLLILWMISRMALLSWADLSYVLPVTSIGYVLVAIIGRFAFDEQISWQRWMGVLLICGGISLVGLTAPKTTGVEAQ